MNPPQIRTRRLVVVSAALLALWAGSLGASYFHLGEYALAVALGFAGLKAALVLLFFMELADERYSINVSVVSAFALIAVFVTFMVADVKTRRPPELLPAPHGALLPTGERRAVDRSGPGSRQESGGDRMPTDAPR